VEKDFKRILAYSTISQLGYMFLGVGVSAYSAGIFHLTTHAFFKALLFLCAGSVMHALAGELQIFRMGGLRKVMPWTYGTFLVGALALSGVPLFSGFFSKDEILYSALASGNLIPWLIGVVTAGLTAFYTFRLLFVAFHGRPRTDGKIEKTIHESPPVMIAPLVILAVLAAVGGFIGLPGRWGIGNAIEHFLHPVFADVVPLMPLSDSLFVDLLLILASLLAVAVGFAVAYWLYIRRWGMAERWARRAGWLYDLVDSKYHVDEAYRAVVVKPLRMLGQALSDVVETQGIDGAVNGLARVLDLTGEGLRRLQTGRVRDYALGITFGAAAVVAYFVVRQVLRW
jgi:NADH-quinone oxidoreductase subunit L